MLKGSGITITLYVITLFLSVPLGLGLALIKNSGGKGLSIAVDIYTWCFRGTPLLLQLFFVYFGLPVVGLTLSPFSSACVAFVLNYTAYLAEIFRGGLEAIEPGQYEAAYCLGLTRSQAMGRIIVPQTLKVVLPPLSNEAITLVKDTALVAAIGLGDVLRAAKQIVTRDFDVTPFLLAALFYLFFSSIVILSFKKIEKRMAYI